MNFIRFIVTVMLCFSIFAAGCGGDGYEFIPATPAQLKGDWEGIFTNNVVENGTITAIFFVDADVLKVTYDLDDGQVMGTSDVSIDGRVITFIGAGTAMKKFWGSLDATSTGLFGQITVDYGVMGIHTGSCELGKI